MDGIDAFIGINMGPTVYQVCFNTAVRNHTKRMLTKDQNLIYPPPEKLCGSLQIIIRQRNKWRAPDIFYSPC